MQNLDSQTILKRLIIAQASFLTLSQKIFLEKNIKSAEALSLLSVPEISLILKRSVRSKSWNGKMALAIAKKSLLILEKFKIGVIFYEDEDFFPMLREMSDPPYSIFFRGNPDCLKQNCVSLVGTRRATIGAKKVAENFGRECCDGKMTVVSGLAFGIDSAAHRGALLSENALLAAVLPSGIDIVVPASSKRLAAKILERGGCILSEYLPGTPGAAFRCVARDRIIAALSVATVVIQAPPGSGALITAKYALDYGRDVMFHAVAFSQESCALNLAVENELKARLDRGANVEYKIKNKAENFLEEGAPVIENFLQFCECFNDLPGKFCKNNENQFLGENVAK